MAAEIKGQDGLEIEQIQEHSVETEEDSDKYLELPADKVFHIFFAYDTADEDFVVEVVHKLESKHSMKCCFSRRDFRPGEQIYSQIYENMKRSMKILLLLSPEFIQSSWCEYETRLAFQMSLEERAISLIPVMYRECAIPICLRSLNYVDCSKGEDLEEKILKSFEPKSQGSDQGKGGGKDLQYDINGARIIFEASLSSPYKTERKWQFSTPSGKHLRSIERAGIKLDMEEFIQFSNDVNNTMMLKYFGFLARSTYSAKVFIFLTQVFNLLVVAIVCSGAGLSPSINRSNLGGFQLFAYSLFTVGIGSVVQVTLMYFFKYMFRRRLQRKVLAYSMRRFSCAKCLLYFDCRQIPTICMIRYDTYPCKVFLMEILKKQYERNNYMNLSDEEQQIKADVRSDSLLEQCFLYYYVELYKWTSLPDADEKRHETVSEKKCLCQLVQDTML